jgi:hypothetical protein
VSAIDGVLDGDAERAIGIVLVTEDERPSRFALVA